MNTRHAGNRAARVVGWLFMVSIMPGRADVWDRQTINDNTSATRSELIHGTTELHDLGARGESRKVADQDWYRLTQKRQSSYEVVVEATSGDVCPADVDRLASDGATVLQTAVAIGTGCSRSLRWVNPGLGVSKELIRVTSGSCTVDCGDDDVYRVRAYETTYSIPRFNNSGTQVSVLLLQNPTNYSVSGTVYFWSAAGDLLGSHDFALSARGSLVLATQTIAPGTSGSVTIANTGRYGDLSGKIVSLEPATGFSFDSLMVPRPL